MKQKFRFIGALSYIGARRLDVLGETFEADPDEVYQEGGVPALPPDVFEEIFSEEDCKRFAHYNSRVDAPPEFIEKTKRAALALAERRAA